MSGLSKEKEVISPNEVKNYSLEDYKESLIGKSVYIDGIKVLQRKERIGYFFTLGVALVLIMLLFVILRMV